MSDIRSPLRFARRKVGDVTLHVAEAGPEDGRPVVLLHGFPEFWYGWRHQIDALAAAGYRVVAPDQRGYNLSDKPAGAAAYDIDSLARDVVGLADAIGEERLLLVGHDWGASVGWRVASHFPGRVEKFVALAAPHPAVWFKAMRDNRAQRKKSRYVGVLRLPVLPEFLMQQGNFKALATALREAKRPEAFSDSDIERYRAAWSEPGALTAMINWYRAPQAKDWRAGEIGRIKTPILILWGEQDKYGVPELAEESARLCESATLVRLDATHWVQHDEPERVSGMVIEFLRG
jgi:pimeloyl-ACP methyl ester carboxylesterase